MQNTQTWLRKASTWQEVQKDQIKSLTDKEDEMKILEQGQNESGSHLNADSGGLAPYHEMVSLL